MRDTQAGVPSAEWPSGATCVQRLDGSRDSAIHTKYRISLRSSSMREPRYPLPRVVVVTMEMAGSPGPNPHGGSAQGHASRVLVPWRIPRRGTLYGQEHGGSRVPTSSQRGPASMCPPGQHCVHMFTGRSALAGIDNDPSAGSPTETLLRLLLPLNDKVQWTSRDVVDDEAPTSPRSEHFTGPFNR